MYALCALPPHAWVGCVSGAGQTSFMDSFCAPSHHQPNIAAALEPLGTAQTQPHKSDQRQRLRLALGATDRHRSTPAVHALLSRLRSGDTVPWSPVLQRVRLHLPPTALDNWAGRCAAEGFEAAAAAAFDDELVTPPAELQKHMSGERNRALRFSDPAVSDWFAALFREVARCARGGIELSPTDLYHCHVFLNLEPVECDEANGNVGAMVDYGVLFHAKEFPAEWRQSRLSSCLPVGAVEAGGPEGDPRFGTKCSTRDPDYHLRNLFWLRSTNAVYQLDPSAPGFELAVPDDDFRTVHVGQFDSFIPGDINYFPRSSGTHDRDAVLCCPRLAFGPSWAIGREVARAGAVAAGAATDLPEVTTAAIVAIVSKLDDADAAALRRLVDAAGASSSCAVALQRRMPGGVREMVCRLLDANAAQRSHARQERNAAQREKLLALGVHPADGDAALVATASENGDWSEMRASNLLQLTNVRHRTPEHLSQFGTDTYDLEEAAAMLKKAVWVDNALMALKLVKQHGMSAEDAVKHAIDESATATEEHIRAEFAALVETAPQIQTPRTETAQTCK